MGEYCIVAARPKNATNQLNSEFKLYEFQTTGGEAKWSPKGWKTIYDISALLEAGHEVLTGKLTEKDGKKSIATGAAVELELRIAENDTKYKISEMPDK